MIFHIWLSELPGIVMYSEDFNLTPFARIAIKRSSRRGGATNLYLSIGFISFLKAIFYV